VSKPHTPHQLRAAVAFRFHDVKSACRPTLVQEPRRHRWPADIVTTMKQNGREMPDAIHPIEDSIRAAQEAVMRPVMRHECREGRLVALFGKG
jgi:hypothetical protein